MKELNKEAGSERYQMYQKNYITSCEGDNVRAGNDARASCLQISLDSVDQVLTVNC
jgi:hypothetical protein